MHRLVSLALLLACAGLAAPAWGTIWRCPDPTWGSIFQNEPCTGSGATALPSAEDPPPITTHRDEDGRITPTIPTGDTSLPPGARMDRRQADAAPAKSFARVKQDPSCPD